MACAACERDGVHVAASLSVGQVGEDDPMCNWTLEEVAIALREGWSAETCDPVDLLDWSPGNRARGQCGSTALVVNDLLGGALIVAEVRRLDGSRQGFHYWNQLPDGSEIDLTRDQFTLGELVQEGRLQVRPPGPPRRCREQYELLRERVLTRLQREA